MATFRVLVSGIPLSATEILNKAVSESFGEGVVDIVSLNKDNLRQMVRLSLRDPQTVLVILDKVSTDLCKSIENGLYSSNKFFSYASDIDLVSFLNDKYSINLPMPEEPELELISESKEEPVYTPDVEAFHQRIQDQSMLIESLQGTITELESQIESIKSGSDSEEKSAKIEDCNNQILSLRDTVSELTAELEEARSAMDSSEEQCKSLEKQISRLKADRDSLDSANSDLSAELATLRVNNSKMSGMIRELESKISSLDTEKKRLEKENSEVSTLRASLKELQSKVSDYSTKISNLTEDCNSKQQTIDSLQRQISNFGDTNKQLGDLRADYASLQSNNSLLNKQLAEYKQRVEEYESRQSDEDDVDELKARIEELERRSEEDNQSLTKLNQEKIELLSQIDVLTKSTSRNVDIEDVMSELHNVKEEYSHLKNGIFGKIASYAMPKSSSPIFLTRKGVTLNHIRFTYAGNSASRKGAYKCLFNELKGYKSEERFLIVDVVAETFVDYVFEIRKVVPGIDWFRQGGGIQRYLSSTCLKNVQVLSPGLSYINEAYFLTVDWEKRITELENSGYNVILFFGDISNMVGRIFHESFADLGNSIIYVEGNATGSRTLVANLKGLSNGPSSVIAYYNFNKQVKRFYAMAARTNECRVLSVV